MPCRETVLTILKDKEKGSNALIFEKQKAGKYENHSMYLLIKHMPGKY